MQKFLWNVLLCTGLSAISLSLFAQASQTRFSPGSTLYDSKGDTLNAHGGGVLYVKGIYYWFGEKRGKGASEGVTVYTSKDLYNWKYEGLALAPSTTPGDDIEFGCIMERPKVIYNPRTKKYVMWFHLELKGKGYAAARAAVAVSDKVTGPYKYLNSFRPNNNMSRDMNLFVDDDGSAYHIYSSDENMDMRIVRLSDDYLSASKTDSFLFRLQREAPAMFKYHGKYYLITSGCTGWKPNKASIHVADNIFGPYKSLGNPMSGRDAGITFYGQSTFVLPVPGKKDAFIYVGDKWNPANLKDSRYQWLPIRFKDGKPDIAWMDQWDLGWFDHPSTAAVTPRRHINFDEDWKFHLGSAASPQRDFNYGIDNIFSKSGEASGTAIAVNFSDKEWETVHLPHDWAVSLPFEFVRNGDIDAHGYKPVGGLFPENSIGWYRKTFTLDHADSGGRYAIRFDGVYRDSKVWINGYYVGGHPSGYTGASYDITDFIRFGKKNVLVVRADATQQEGWFYEGAGIYRHVWLENYQDLHLASDGGVFVHTESTPSKTIVTTESTLENRGLLPASATIQTILTDRSGKELARSKPAPLSLAVNEHQTLKQTLDLKDPTLWSLDNPYLYRTIVLVRSGGVLVDSVNTRFGVRTIAFDAAKGFFLNGKPVKVQGVCNHQDHAGVGAALPDYLQYYRIQLLKEMGANAYRTSHNPPTPELLDACDSLGMLVMDETRLLTSGEEYSGQLHDLILRDRNHPSIFIWSIGNEEYATHHTDIGKRIAQNQVLLQQQLDPYRTSTYAANMGNYFTGVNEVIPVRGFNYNLFGIDGYHKDHPGQPVIGTEVASTVSTRSIYIKDTVRAYVPDYDSTFPSWASTGEYWWKMAAARDWFMGGFVWTGFDYRGEPTPYTWPNINSHFGLMDVCGFPKNVYYYYQSWWTDKDILHIAPHWNWKGEEGKPKLVWINTNADRVELFLNGKSLGEKEMPRNGHLRWTVNYEPGTLEAIATKQGRKISAKVETTGEAYSIRITPTRTTFRADGGDATVCNISVVDQQGREVPDAGALIHFSLTGDAQIIGTGNGDPSSHESDKCADGAWQRHLFGGKAQVIIQSGKSAGTISFHAEGAGLQSASVNLTTTP